jgi:hypothetical protein
MDEPLPPTSVSPEIPSGPFPAKAGRRVGARAARLCFWSPFAGASVFILAVTAGATKAAGHPILMFATVGISTLIYAGGLALGMAGLRRMRMEGRQGILGRALVGAALDGVLLALMVWLTGFLISDARRTVREREKAAELEAQRLAASVGGGAALEKALEAAASQNFAAVLRELQRRYDSASAALTNPPVLDMALVKSQGELKARAEAVRRMITAAKNLQQFAEHTPDIYRQELQRHKLSPQAREAELQQFMEAMSVVNPTIIALRRAEVRQGEALLRVVLFLDETWGQWEYRPATRDLGFKDPKQADDYSVTYQEFDATSEEAQSLKKQLTIRNP